MAKKKAKKKATRKARTRKAAAKLALGAEIGIRDVAALHETLLGLSEETRPVTLDAEAVSRVDFAILQVLAAFVRDRRERDLDTRIDKPTEALLQAARRVDLHGVLGLAGG